MKKKFLFTFIFLCFILTGCRNPFYDYPDNYSNVLWTSTDESELDLKIYVLDRDNTNCSYAVLTYNDVVYEMTGYMDHYLYLEEFDEYGFSKVQNSDSINTHFSRIVNGLYETTVVGGELLNGELIGKKIVLEKNDLKNSDINPYIFTQVSYFSDTLNFFSTNVYDFQRCVTTGEILIDRTFYDTNLIFYRDNSFIVCEKNNNRNIYFKGTAEYSNDVVTLNINENNINDTKIIELEVLFTKEYGYLQECKINGIYGFEDLNKKDITQIDVHWYSNEIDYELYTISNTSDISNISTILFSEKFTFYQRNAFTEYKTKLIIKTDNKEYKLTLNELTNRNHVYVYSSNDLYNYILSYISNN
ncbi:MAG: hypothetical protein R3Y60_04665 [bacterium]